MRSDLDIGALALAYTAAFCIPYGFSGSVQVASAWLGITAFILYFARK